MLKKILYSAGLFLLILFLLILINQLVSFYNNLYTVHPLLAIVGTAFLGVVLLALAISPFVLLVKLPAPLPFPDSDTDLDKYLVEFKKRLAKHPVCREHRLDPHDAEGLRIIDEKLKEKADKIIFESASAVFISTAISQNGKLDAFTVLAAQARLIWKVSHVYWQRPSLRNLQQLYTNVAINAMAASGIEQIDLSQQIQPIVNAMLKSPGKHIPVVGNATHIITESILEGTVNAFLTLRVGVLTKNYCFPEVRTINDIKSNSFIEASGLLKTLVVKSSAKVVEGILKAGKNAGIQTFKTGYDAVLKGVKTAKHGLTGLFSK
ncbi:MAG: YcjF family protein [Cytophagales bacterium]|nr:YcjF family protein [Cytophagales bacterium]